MYLSDFDLESTSRTINLRRSLRLSSILPAYPRYDHRISGSEKVRRNDRNNYFVCQNSHSAVDKRHARRSLWKSQKCMELIKCDSMNGYFQVTETNGERIFFIYISIPEHANRMRRIRLFNSFSLERLECLVGNIRRSIFSNSAVACFQHVAFPSDSRATYSLLFSLWFFSGQWQFLFQLMNWWIMYL